jgi:flagellar protein FlaG
MELLPVGGSPVIIQEPQRAPRAPAAPVSEPAPAVDPQKIQQATAALNRAMAALSADLEFSSDQESGVTVIRVMDTQTKQVIRQIPSEDVLTITHAIDDVIHKMQGVLFKQKA